MNNESHKPDISRIKQNFLLGQTHMQLIGFKKASNGLSRLEDKSGIKVRMNWDSTNTLIYESVIPLKTFYREKLSNSDSAKIFTLTTNVNGIEMPGMPKGGPPGREGPGGEGSGQMSDGGGRPGGPPHDGFGMGTKSIMTGKNVFSKNLKLEVKAHWYRATRGELQFSGLMVLLWLVVILPVKIELFFPVLPLKVFSDQLVERDQV